MVEEGLCIGPGKVVPSLFSVMDPFDDLAESCGTL